ncbi:hypothetical protein LZ009_03385 [Ramlibacter sp. XY19]|uniref:hypothetical protein n=1 Tax=Ramlibacter paludis TaxID=2908000 RepID=UPI0023DB3490|nr:hypothetical protein [Ramlibacter paludis]MCG2591815.1 hypothetical protein [Ramlibacter paludis]
MQFTNLPAAGMLAIATALVAACASGPGVPNQPYAQFEPAQGGLDADTRPAFLLEVDGEVRSIERNDPVQPGLRKLVLSVPAGNNVAMGYGGSRRLAVTIDAKPCVRYYLAARRSADDAREWRAFVAGTEAISGCRA